MILKELHLLGCHDHHCAYGESVVMFSLSYSDCLHCTPADLPLYLCATDVVLYAVCGQLVFSL